jgi:hypothetical protein
MKTSSHASKRTFLLIISVLVGITSIASAGRQEVYFRFTDPGSMSPNDDPYHPQDNPNGWRNDVNNTGEINYAPGDTVYFGMINNEALNFFKSVHLELDWGTYNPSHTFTVSSKGFYTGSPSMAAGNISSKGRNKKNISVSWPDCPKWEYIKLENTSTSTQSMITIIPKLKSTKCYKPRKRRTGPGPGPDDTFEITDGTIGVISQMLNPMRITEIQIFPENSEIDQAVLPEFNALPHTGNWTAQFVPVDPDGTPRTGVQFISDGTGLMAEDMYNLNFSMIDLADNRYTFYAFDEDEIDWTEFIIDFNEYPWFENLEIYPGGETLGDSSWWRSWDDEPLFDTSVSDLQSRSVVNSMEVRDNTDIVRVFDGANSGYWRFEAWQYVPAEFTSGGTGPFDGSFFVMLNTYQSGQPHNNDHFSVQMQADSNGQKMKVLHGQGTDFVEVVLPTNRWTKIQIDIDLEDDWTRVYYDDDFVAEYSWTGGVLGGGSGSPQIDAIDFVASGSSSIFYDDLSLRQVCPADLTDDGDLNFLDVSAFLAAFGENDPVADFVHDSNFNFLDVSAFLAAFAKGCP